MFWAQLAGWGVFHLNQWAPFMGMTNGKPCDDLGTHCPIDTLSLEIKNCQIYRQCLNVLIQWLLSLKRSKLSTHF